MAVEARHLNLFPPPQPLSNRELGMNGVEGNGNVFSGPMVGYGGLGAPFSESSEIVVPMYGAGNFLAKTSASRKRPREAAINSVLNNNNNNRCGGGFTFLGEDISFQIQQQQFETDRFIAQHTEKVRLEIEERRKRYTPRIAAAVEENVLRKLKARDEEIDRMRKLNQALEERVKSLCLENQIWRDLAQTNEATANALRSNLEQVLAEDERRRRRRQRGELTDDANSCCGSNYEEEEEGVSKTDGHDNNKKLVVGDGCIGARKSRMCRSCGREESCVLVLPCRHLCLCTVCGSTLHTCPVCNASKTASVHVNFSSS